MDSDLLARLTSALAPAYQVEGEIGRGGMAIVYRGRDLRLKRGVAVKLLPPELAFRDEIRSRFLREAEMAARLSHPNIVPIYSVDERDGLVYFVMGLVEGESVGDHIRRTGPLPIDEARRILREVADALAYAHAHGVVHRDIKPDNVLLDGATGRAMVTDFGIARAATEEEGSTRLTATGTAIGTPAYMSPEQCAGDRGIDGRSDLYSLGAVAYQMLTGDPPFTGNNTPAVMVKHATETPPPLRARRADVAEDLETIVMRLLEKDPTDRFPDGAALVAALDGAPLAPLRRAPPTHSIGEVVDGATSSNLARSRGVPPDVAERILAHTKNARELRDERRRAKRGDTLSAIDRVKKTRARMASYLGTSLFLFGINYVTGDGFWWCLFPIFGIGLGVARDIGRLWADGVPLRALVSSKALRDLSALPAVGAARAPALGTPPSAALPPGVSDDTLNGPFGAVLRQGIADHKTITDLESRLSEAERKLLPDVQATADSLFQRLVLLSGGLHRLDQQLGTARLPDLDQRIAQLEVQTTDAVRSRPLALLKRQRDMLADLTTSRARLLEQFESAALLLQNLSLDMLKVRSSGLDSALSGITSATQEARALSREIGYALDAAAEMKEMERKGTV